MEYLVSIILGVVEGITEFLPISSTGHLILVSHLLPVVSSEFWKSFMIIIQLGAILSVVVLYWNKLWQVKLLWGKLLTAFIPTAILGLIFYKLIKTYLLNNTLIVVMALLIGGILIILFEKYYHPKEIETEVWPTYKQSFVIGLFQSIAMIPGVSRSAATILGGLSLGISRKTIVEFSFLLAIPTMIAATGLDLLKVGTSFSREEWVLLVVGFVTSFLVAIWAVKFLVRYIQKHDFTLFGWYRIILALLFLIFLYY